MTTAVDSAPSMLIIRFNPGRDIVRALLNSMPVIAIRAQQI